ncbi:MAG: hypothetical protein H7249_12020 [Chitinophagaceae bacterium]|nr:hypothetical protein [Oligoflexus sp.]
MEKPITNHMLPTTISPMKQAAISLVHTDLRQFIWGSNILRLNYKYG